ncbi:helix-turn-helix domain-containing protein [Zobellia galactanivorans]|uniref:AraC-type transcriptional regulator n=1 Tax=Zobellia galactanivorans (strain DSM 12802 / CCUG 47099 / CIP 106680 / NCIMB 13871 / Dsij) TaxID=63186 RepID=G0LCT5_ZOBGA|nr:AraC family transcriptional regulator [Zobellia galactanivorans]CAZ97175.1 AraC-type transcriptional regulator [Zobellia galactanivorans]
MRIGLFPSGQYRVDQGGDLVSSIHENVPKAVDFQQEKELNGSCQELRLEGARILLKKFSLENPSTVPYENLHSCLGLHFLLQGTYKFTGIENKAKVGIQSGHYNLVQWPSILGTQKFKGLDYTSVEIFFTRKFLEDLLGKEVDSVLRHFIAEDKEAKLLWSKGQVIPGKLRVPLLEMLNCPFSGSAKTNYIESQIRCLLIEVFLGRGHSIGEHGEAELPILDNEAIERVVGYIKQNLKKKLTIKELSEIAGFNTTKLKTCFKKVHQTTIFKYITRLRMERAKTLIVDENCSIAQASYEVGYSNPQHFTVAFKKTMGYLPSTLLSVI